jgi:hypothetical protein
VFAVYVDMGSFKTILGTSNGLGLLVLVVTVGLLQLLDQGDVSLLGLLGGDALVDNLLPGLVLGFAL